MATRSLWRLGEKILQTQPTGEVFLLHQGPRTAPTCSSTPSPLAVRQSRQAYDKAREGVVGGMAIHDAAIQQLMVLLRLGAGAWPAASLGESLREADAWWFWLTDGP
jgi:hypothetical protein